MDATAGMRVIARARGRSYAMCAVSMMCTRMRLRRLRTLRARLDVVASLCGFSGANYLCRVFKKETGQSPAQWRALAGHTAQSGLSPEEALREQELYI